jgi:hypothetical protein
MRGHLSKVVLLALLIVGTVAGSVNAALDHKLWYTLSDGVAATRPVSGSDWIATPTQNGSWFSLSPGQHVWFAMDNYWQPGHATSGYFQVSTVNPVADSLGFFRQYSVPVAHGCEYSSDDRTLAAPTYIQDDWWEAASARGNTLTVEFEIRPRPSWEWIRLTNPSSDNVTFNSASGYSVCSHTPEPSLGLLLLAGMIPLGIGIRRRYRINAK